MIFLELIRYRNCMMAGFASVIGSFIAYTQGDFIMLLVFLVVFLITGAGNAINDYFDVAIDAINRPERPIPSGRIKKEYVFVVSMLLFIIGIIIAYSISIIPFFIAIFNSFLLYFYAYSLKRKLFVGNLSVSYLSGSTFLFGGSAYGVKGIEYTLVLFLLSMLTTLAREIVKAIEDIEGDKKNNASTLPVCIGERASSYIASIMGILAVTLSPLPYIEKIFNENYLIVVAIADAFFLYAVYLILKMKPRDSSRYFKIAMFFGLIAFISGSLSL